MFGGIDLTLLILLSYALPSAWARGPTHYYIRYDAALRPLFSYSRPGRTRTCDSNLRPLLRSRQIRLRVDTRRRHRFPNSFDDSNGKHLVPPLARYGTVMLSVKL